MPSMRELLQDIRCGGSDFVGPFTYGLLEKVVQALEPKNVDTSIRKLRQRAEVAESRLVEAKAEIERLNRQISDTVAALDAMHKAWDEDQVLKQQLTQARDDARQAVDSLCKTHCRQLTLAADAALGELVRGMKSGTSLRRSAACYHSWHYTGRGWEALIDSANPAKALRSIQEEE